MLLARRRGAQESDMAQTFDAIVIGSGFGGAVAACRLAEKGLKVLVLERGRRWSPGQYPRKPGDPWLFNVRQPEKRNGWLDLRIFKNMIVAQGAGVGGGSLSYSSVSLEADPSLFAGAWPREITYPELKPYYESVARQLDLQTIPDGQLTRRIQLTREAANSLGHGDRFAKAPLAVSFDPAWNYQLPDPFDHKHSRTFTNAHGQQQGTCIHLGNCDIGCDVRAKNTLDLNYLPLAERRGAEIRPLHVVRRIEPDGTGYRVAFDRIDDGQLTPGSETAARVFVAAGSLGSTELLLRCRDEHGTLPGVSAMLGRHWSPNANVLSMARYSDPSRVDQSTGPTIGSAVDFMDGGEAGQRFVIEDDGFPNVLLNALQAAAGEGAASELTAALVQAIGARLREKNGTRGVMVWLGAGIDAADGELTLKRAWPAFWNRALDLEWSAERSTAVVEAILAMQHRMTEATGGDVRADIAWHVFRSLITLHPLGGCRMGDSAATGVVDHLGRVFGYPGLYVVDGAILPGSVGRNPSHTIAALAERIAAQVS
jgi:cholesterol oxidase